LVIGAAGLDFVGRLRGELQLSGSNPAHIRPTFGGVARNVAENLGRLGHPVRLLSAVGEDPIGEQLLQYTSEAGVDVSLTLRTQGSPTSAYLAIINARGRLQTALDDMRAVTAITPAVIDANARLFLDSSLVFVDANLPRETLARILTLAKQSGLPVCADPTTNMLAKKLIPHLNKFYLLVPNLMEAGVLCGRAPAAAGAPAAVPLAVESAKCLVASGVNVAVITLAELGVCYATSRTSGNIPAIQTEVVDPTGGGDALTATTLFGLLNNIPLDDALRLGATAAALTLRYSGAVVPDLSLEKLYDELVL
jgi:pseudouridine kinase